MYLRRGTEQVLLAGYRASNQVAIGDQRSITGVINVAHISKLFLTELRLLHMNKTILKAIAYFLNTVGLLLAILFIILIIRGI
jgi:hypothetical protein